MKNKNIFHGYIWFTLLTGIFFTVSISQNIRAQQKMGNDSMQMKDSTLMMRREMIHSRSSMVMPFNMNKVTHFFIKTKNGGILMIKSKNAQDTLQIGLIRDHLKKEHKLFSNADFKDPKTLHGANMPGLKVLTNSKNKFKVNYKKLSDGAELTFTSTYPAVIKALHIWFDAQLKDHGKDARSHE
jgi:hypothetical protein